MKKRRVMALLLSTLMVFSLAACGTSGTSGTSGSGGDTQGEASETKESEAKEEAGKTRKITALVQQSRNFDGLQNMIKKLEDEENIKVDVQVVPDDESLNMIKMKLNSGESPDIIDYNVPAIYDIVNPEENFADMSNEDWVDKLKIPDNVTADDGKIYGFPFLSVPGVHGFIYNKDVFEECNVSVPTTWEEFLDVCQKIKDSGKTPIHMPKDTWVPQILMTDNFAKALGKDAVEDFSEKVMKNEAKWTDVPELAEVIDQYLELYEKGYINTDFASATYDDSILAVAEGNAAMHFNGDFFAASVLEANPDANIGMFSMSMTDGVDVMTENMSSAGFVVYKNSKNLDTVKEVLNLWSTPEYANLYFEDRPAFPAMKDVDGGDVPEYLQDVNEKFIDSGKVIPEFNYSVMDLNSLFESTLYVYYVDAPAKGNMNGQQVMEKFQGDFEQYMKDQGTEGF
ncbi:MAG TPA: carbohydrate ABC transporter substrate-binding protein [Candidatus Merdenecus merdavium]|nr:carbohydrate ABC transporter substrate-binding protein [Candidatus Merdenecus merdavium]